MERSGRPMQTWSRAGAGSRIQTLSQAIQLIVNPLRLLVDAFVNIFGITAPTRETEARAGRVIALMLAGVLAVLGAVVWLLRASLTH